MTTGGRLAPLLFVAAIGMDAATQQAAALEVAKNEKALLETCEKRVCQMIVRKSPASGDLTCNVSKTWARKSIADGAKKGLVAWDFGDARCTLDLRLPRALIVEALAGPKVKLELPRHEVSCEVERDKETTPIRIELAPRIEFKHGKARQVWVNVKKVDGPTAIKGLVIAVAKVEDTVGLFQKRMLKAVNKFIGEKCPKVAAGR